MKKFKIWWQALRFHFTFPTFLPVILGNAIAILETKHWDFWKKDVGIFDVSIKERKKGKKTEVRPYSDSVLNEEELKLRPLNSEDFQNVGYQSSINCNPLN